MPEPEVSIGVPVFNGEEYLTEAIGSLLGQSFTDFELIISDNASTDGTPQICAEFAARDARVRWLRQPDNIGAGRNWNVVVDQARGTFFKWASANDLCHVDMLARCLDVMRSDARVVLCYGRTFLTHDDGTPIGVYEHDIEAVDSRPSDRFRRLRDGLLLNNAQAGLIRLDALKRTALDRLYPTGDLVLMAELALLGHFRLLPDVLLNRRMGRRGSATHSLAEIDLNLYVDPYGSGAQMRRWRTHLDCVQSVWRSPIQWEERLRALAYTARGAYWDRGALIDEGTGLLRRAWGKTQTSVAAL